MTFSINRITCCLIVTIAGVLTSRPITATGTWKLTLVPSPSSGTLASASHMVTRPLAAVACLLTLRTPGALRTRIHAEVTSEPWSTATPS